MVCIDIGQPINPNTGQIQIDFNLIYNSCTPCVRLNFILGPYNSPDDPQWQQIYNQIVNTLLSAYIKIHALIGHEAVKNNEALFTCALSQENPQNQNIVDQWINEYVYNFVSIVDKFKNRIRVFESFNEPNNWWSNVCGPTAIVHPKWFAYLIQQVYLNVKYFNNHWGDPTWQVTLISGPLLTHDLDNGSTYLDNTYWYGKNVWAWDWTHQQTGSYPLDGVGMHIYVQQGSTDPNLISSAMQNNINAIWNTIISYEGWGTQKKIWVSEFGWQSSAVGQNGQANNMTTGFNTLLNDNRIAISSWYTLKDWGETWGIYDINNNPKQSYWTFRNIANYCQTPSGKYEFPNKGVLKIIKPDGSIYKTTTFNKNYQKLSLKTGFYIFEIFDENGKKFTKKVLIK